MNNFNIVTSILGVVLIAFTAFLYKNTITYLDVIEVSNGRVIAVIEAEDGASFAPRVEFETLDGTKVTFISPTTTTDKTDYQIGQEVSVGYNPHAYQDARINSFFALWGFIIIFGSVGVLLLVISMVSFLFKQGKKQG